jgi:glycine/D-amino acid oxidase-like deaminating enzyme
MPLVGRCEAGLVFNGLGSKGSLYAPGVARRLAAWLIDGAPLEAELDVSSWLGGVSRSDIL